MQVALGFFICVVMMSLHIHINPYHDPIQNRLSLLCLAQLACILFVGLLFKVDTVGEGSTSSDVLSFFIVFLSVFLVVVPIIDAAFAFGLIGKSCVCDDRLKFQLICVQFQDFLTMSLPVSSLILPFCLDVPCVLI